MERLGRFRRSGLTLAEMLIVIAVVSVLALVALPSIRPNEPGQLDLAAAEVAGALRLAVSESRRLGANGIPTYILVDGKNDPGKLRLYVSTSTAQIPPTSGTSTLADPLTKLAAVVDTGTGNVLKGITLTPFFNGAGQPRGQLLISRNPSQFKAFDGVSNDQGALQANSGVRLALGSNTVIVSFNEVTGLVTKP